MALKLLPLEDEKICAGRLSGAGLPKRPLVANDCTTA
jgi:hypothetical protein